MMTVITGGSGSGKSAFAEHYATRKGRTNPLYYIATMKVDSTEGKKRILRHQTMRKGKGFFTIEQPYDIVNIEQVKGLSGKIDSLKNSTILLECLSNLLANEWFDRGIKAEAVFKQLIDLNSQCNHLVIVTNEIFSDGLRYDAATTDYMKQLGWLNSVLAKAATEVYEVVYGIPICIVNRHN